MVGAVFPSRSEKEERLEGEINGCNQELEEHTPEDHEAEEDQEQDQEPVGEMTLHWEKLSPSEFQQLQDYAACKIFFASQHIPSRQYDIL